MSQATSLFLGNPWVPDYNYEPSPNMQLPSAVPAQSPDGYSVYANQQNLGMSIDTSMNFYPESPSPNYTGKNVTTIAGQKYEVTALNYSRLARMYIDHRANMGDYSYYDDTPATNGDGTPTTVGNLRIIALVDAYRQIAGLKPIYYSVDPLTGVAVPNDQAYSNVINNPVTQVADAISNAGTQLFNGGSSFIQGGAQAVTDLAGTLGTVGDFLKKPGTIIVIAAGIGMFFLWKNKVI